MRIEIIDGIKYRLDEDKLTAEVSQMMGYKGDIIITETVVFNEVTYSGTSIGEKTFDGCSSLTSITIPNSVTSIGDRAFCCAPMRKLVIRNIRKWVTEKETTTVTNSSSLTSVTLPESLTELGKNVFHGCEKLETIYVPTTKANFSREHLPETLHDKIVEFELPNGD